MLRAFGLEDSHIEAMTDSMCSRTPVIPAPMAAIRGLRMPGRGLTGIWGEKLYDQDLDGVVNPDDQSVENSHRVRVFFRGEEHGKFTQNSTAQRADVVGLGFHIKDCESCYRARAQLCQESQQQAATRRFLPNTQKSMLEGCMTAQAYETFLVIESFKANRTLPRIPVQVGRLTRTY